MADSFSGSPLHCAAMGVLKFSQEQAGYPDVKNIAEEWVKIPEFKQVIVRKVSKDNYGIQFIYYEQKDGDEADGKEFNKWFIGKFIDTYQPKVYAWDVNIGTSSDKGIALKGIFKNELF